MKKSTLIDITQGVGAFICFREITITMPMSEKFSSDSKKAEEFE
jgi:hypothetical protein